MPETVTDGRADSSPGTKQDGSSDDETTDQKAPDGGKDSAMVVTLLPGAWTVQVGGLANTSGVVLVEIYALP